MVAGNKVLNSTWNGSRSEYDLNDSNLINDENKLGLSWAELSHSWGLKQEFEVKV